jgi:hypothetical protein
VNLYSWGPDAFDHVALCDAHQDKAPPIENLEIAYVSDLDYECVECGLQADADSRGAAFDEFLTLMAGRAPGFDWTRALPPISVCCVCGRELFRNTATNWVDKINEHRAEHFLDVKRNEYLAAAWAAFQAGSWDLAQHLIKEAPCTF